MDGVDRVGIGRGVGELLPQAFDVRVDRPLRDVHVVRIRLAQQLDARLDDPGTTCERLEKIELRERERKRLAVPSRLEPAEIEPERTCFDDLLFRPFLDFLPDARSPQKCTNARDELAKCEGLAEIVVRSELEAEDAVELLVFRGEEEDRQLLAACAKTAAELEAVEARHEDVEDGEVGQSALEPVHRLEPVRERLYAKAIAPECHGHSRPQALFVIDEGDEGSGCAHAPNLLQNGAGNAAATKTPQISPGTSHALRGLAPSDTQPAGRAVRDEGEEMFETEGAEETPRRRLRYPVMVELIILGGLVLVLMIALMMIQSLVYERKQRADSVRGEIASSWAQSQTIGGPVIILPYLVRSRDAEGKEQVATNRARLLPDRLKVTGRLVPERRHRGIYETVVYRADLALEGEFARPDFSLWNVKPEDILWNEAVVTIGVPDLRGIRGTPMLKWNDKVLRFTGGSADAKLWPSGLTAETPLDAAAKRYVFSLDLDVNGSEMIGFYPLGDETVVELTSPWPSPSFGGAFLPESRSVAQKGFTARWSVSSLARSYPQRWRDWGDENTNIAAAIPSSAFTVGLYTPVSHYQQTERSMKYGALFIVLTFLTFFLYELLSPVTLHPVQYFLVGGALCLFYLLLLTISEHAPFAIAYAIASVATIALISFYGAALLGTLLRVLGLTAVLSLLYGYLYVLLQLEDWALLMGSIGLFLILALVMYTTRRVDWGTVHQGKALPSSEQG